MGEFVIMSLLKNMVFSTVFSEEISSLSAVKVGFIRIYYDVLEFDHSSLTESDYARHLSPSLLVYLSDEVRYQRS